MRHFLCGTSASLVALAAFQTQAVAQPRPTPLQGYHCVMINQTLDQMRDPAQAVVFKGKPDDAAPAISPASTVIAVKDDATPINGYYPALNFGLKPVWVSAKTLAPYKSASDPTAQCQPGVKADGHLGFIFTH